MPAPRLDQRLKQIQQFKHLLQRERMEAELEKRLTESQMNQLATAARMPAQLRRKAERARFRSESDYFRFLVDRANRDGRR